MPIYEFKCSGCGKKIEVISPMSERGSHRVCPECGVSMNRLMGIPFPPIVPVTGRDQVLSNLNAKNDGRGNYPHHKEAMWKGLNQREPITGRGF